MIQENEQNINRRVTHSKSCVRLNNIVSADLSKLNMKQVKELKHLGHIVQDPDTNISIVQDGAAAVIDVDAVRFKK